MSWRTSIPLFEIVHDKLTIGDLDNELSDNTWRISMSSFERHSLTADDLIEFFDAILKDRESQLREQSLTHGMYFYVWYDRQTSQLRFSLISDFNETLPFNCQIAQTELKAVVHQFLAGDDVIPYSKLTVSEYAQENLIEEVTSPYTLKVYKKHLVPKEIKRP